MHKDYANLTFSRAVPNKSCPKLLIDLVFNFEVIVFQMGMLTHFKL